MEKFPGIMIDYQLNLMRAFLAGSVGNRARKVVL